ncbi:hypothetical protein ACFXNW_07590 [Nocardia sp. NPDC059180]|uniref:hypothetical protein n=1 Tax=Nocardia sp. NPDC059180 TaxID=3346761 RepID=UPI0036B9F8BA
MRGIAAYSAFDIAAYIKAERRFRFARWCADTAGSWELRAATLADMARKTAYIGNPDGALSLIELAQVRSGRLTHTTRAMLATLRAQFLSALGRTDDALSEVARADEHFAARNPIGDVPWMCYYDHAEHLGSTGKAPDSRRHSTRSHRPGRTPYPTSHPTTRRGLPSLTNLLPHPPGDPDHATGRATHGSRPRLEAVADATKFRSQRIRDELRNLATTATPHRRITDVAELRHAIAVQPELEAIS